MNEEIFGHALVNFQSVAVGSSPEEKTASNGTKYLKFKVKCHGSWFFVQAWEGTPAYEQTKKLKLKRGKIINALAEQTAYQADVIKPDIWNDIKKVLTSNTSGLSERTKEWVEMMPPVPDKVDKYGYKLIQIDYAVPYSDYQKNIENYAEAEKSKPKQVTDTLKVSGFGE